MPKPEAKPKPAQFRLPAWIRAKNPTQALDLLGSGSGAGIRQDPEPETKPGQGDAKDKNRVKAGEGLNKGLEPEEGNGEGRASKGLREGGCGNLTGQNPPVQTTGADSSDPLPRS